VVTWERGLLPSPSLYWEMKMAEFLSEINIGKKVIEPVLSVFKKKKNKSKMLEEQIRDTLPCDVEELEEKEDEKF